MCFFITIAVPSDDSLSICREFSGGGLLIEPTANPSAKAGAGEGLSPLLVMLGDCSCAFYMRPRNYRIEQKREKAVAKYRRLGWSESKIERALASMPSEPHPDDGLHPAIVELLQTLVERCDSVKVWVHDFRGKVEVESYSIEGALLCTRDQLPEFARGLGLDICLTVSGDGSAG